MKKTGFLQMTWKGCWVYNHGKIEYSPAAKKDLELIQKHIKDSYGDKVSREVLYTITTQIRIIHERQDFLRHLSINNEI